MRIILAVTGACVWPALAGCGQPQTKPPVETAARRSAPAVPEEISSVAQTLLGSEAEVLVFGDLARTGKQQVLAINRLPKTPAGVVPGILLTRAVVAEKEGGKWTELLRCDEHLKNTNGFLGLTPLDPVTGWRLQYEQDAEKGLQLYFTPLRASAGSHIPPIGVRWNPATKRYQSLDRSFQQFLLEVPALEKMNSVLR